MMGGRIKEKEKRFKKKKKRLEENGMDWKGKEEKTLLLYLQVQYQLHKSTSHLHLV